MKINTIIKKYQDELIGIINKSATELPPAIIQIILRDILHQVDTQVNIALQSEAVQDISGEQTEVN